MQGGTQEANEPAPGTDDYWRICTPYPFDLWLPARDAGRAFELRIDELESFAYFSPGAQLLRHRSLCDCQQCAVALTVVTDARSSCVH